MTVHQSESETKNLLMCNNIVSSEHSVFCFYYNFNTNAKLLKI